jgi:uncharacterized GH25 family protein
MPEKAVFKVGEEAVMKVLYEGEPLKGKKCIVFNRGWQDLMNMTTDDKGELRFTADLPGLYIIVTNHADPNKRVDEEFDETVFHSSLTIEAE